MLTPHEREAVAEEASRMQSKAEKGRFSAEPISGWNGEYFLIEMSGIGIDMGMGTSYVEGEIVLSRESARAAMESLAKALGEQA